MKTIGEQYINYQCEQMQCYVKEFRDVGMNMIVDLETRAVGI